MSRILIGFFCAFLIVSAAAAASADEGTQEYVVRGSDAFRIAGRDLQSVITYSGSERLTFSETPRTTAFHATVNFEKNDGTATVHDRAAFALSMSPSGAVSDEHDADPDYLTILNQPFSIQLDAPTMRDLHALTAAVPFDSPSPMTGAPLHGMLRRLPDVRLNGVRVLGIAFSAHGPLQGTLPDRPSVAVTGTITMNGTAYYAYATALLLALDATLLIDGKVGGTGGNDAVMITYKRSIHPARR